MKISIVIATYNEIENIYNTLEKISTVLKGNDFEIIVVDDDSPDLTWQAVEKVSAQDPRVRVIRRTTERGLATALHTGIKSAQGQIVAWLDCDLQHPPEKLLELKQAIEDGYDLASASRFNSRLGKSGDARVEDRKGPFIIRFHGFLSYILNYAITFICRSDITDWTSGMVAFKKSELDKLIFKGDHGEYLMFLLFQSELKHLKIIEIPYVLQLREQGDSKSSNTYKGLFRLGLKYLRTMGKLFFYSVFPKRLKKNFRDPKTDQIAVQTH